MEYTSCSLTTRVTTEWNDLKDSKNIFFCLLLVTSCLIVYLPSIRHDFIPLYDDTPYVLCNPSAQGISLANIKAAFTGFYCGNYAPFHIISYMFNYVISGLNPSGYILTNILIHTVNGLLVYFLFLRSSFTPRYACLASYIFLLHPVQVESVVWISERKTVLSMLFFLAAMHFHLNYFRGKSGTNYILSILSFVSALLSKSTAVVLPLYLICYDTAYRKSEKQSQKLKDKIPFIIIAVAGACITLYSQDSSRFGGRTTYHGGSPLATFFTMLPVLVKYIKMIFYPIGLTVYYGNISAKSFFDEDVFLAGLAAISLLAFGVYLFRRNKELFCWYAVFFVGLLPVSQIVPIVTLINDRYLYFPMVGAAGFCVAVIRLINEQYVKTRKWFAVISVILCLTLSWLTYLQTKTWQNTFTLYRQIIFQNNEHIDYNILQDQNLLQTDVKGLLEVSDRLLKNFPSSPEVLKFASRVYVRANNLYAAQQCLEKLIVVAPSDMESLILLASVYKMTEQLPAAKKVYENILLLNPGSEAAKRGLKEIGF